MSPGEPTVEERERIVRAARDSFAKLAAVIERASASMAALKTANARLAEALGSIAELGSDMCLVPLPWVDRRRLRVRAHLHLPRARGLVCPVDIWHDRLWYGLQPHTGLNATGTTRAAVELALREEISHTYLVPARAVILRQLDCAYPWGMETELEQVTLAAT